MQENNNSEKFEDEKRKFTDIKKEIKEMKRKINIISQELEKQEKLFENESYGQEDTVIDSESMVSEKAIEPEKKATLFQRFMEGAEGTGLGLSVVYALTDTFGGTIAVGDRVDGDYTQGTVFTVTLPAITE